MKRNILLLSLILLFLAAGVLLALSLPRAPQATAPEPPVPSFEALPVRETPPPSETLFLKLKGDALIVYEDSSCAREIERTAITPAALPEAEREELTRGFSVTPEELKHLMEDYTS